MGRIAPLAANSRASLAVVASANNPIRMFPDGNELSAKALCLASFKALASGRDFRTRGRSRMDADRYLLLSVGSVPHSLESSESVLPRSCSSGRGTGRRPFNSIAECLRSIGVEDDDLPHPWLFHCNGLFFQLL